MEIPDDLKYTKEHEWVQAEGDTATIGITDFAQDRLGDITYVELPAVGDEVAKEEPMGVVESVKAVSDVYAPVSGEVIEVNDDLAASPQILNEDPYGEGWMVKVRMSDPSELDDLLDAAAYQEYIAEQEE